MSESNENSDFMDEILNDENINSESEKIDNLSKNETSKNNTTISLVVDEIKNEELIKESLKNIEENIEKINDNDSEEVFSNNLKSVLNMKENVDIKYGLLIGLIKVNQIQNKEIVDAVLQLLVNGPFDMEENFLIHSPKCVGYILEVIEIVEPPLKAQLLSVFCGILRKSKCNLMMTMETGLTERALLLLQEADSLVEQLLVELLGVVASFNISVKELKMIFQMLQGSNGIWPKHSAQLLSVLQQMPNRSGPDEFFNFPGTMGSAISIPPISKWPYQNGWTFNCWVHLDATAGMNIDRDNPFLYCFRTNKGLGYSGHFSGNNFVITTMKLKDKGLQHCVKYNFKPRKWYMITVVYVYNRWSKSEIRCYVDGQLTSQVEMSWQITTNDSFDRCCIGATPEQRIETLLTGQMSCIYGFSESLNPHQVAAIYSLGHSYKGNFKFEAESPLHLSDSQKKSAFEGRLNQSLMFSYNPVACDRQLCLDQAPKTNNSPFAHASHALMMGDVRPVLTQSIYSTLHSLGGIRILYPLFGQLDFKYTLSDKSVSESSMTNIGAQLIHSLLELLRSSSAVRQQLVQSKGLLVITHYLSGSDLFHQLNLDFFNSIVLLCHELGKIHIEHLSNKHNSPAFADQLVAMASGPKFQYASVGHVTSKNGSNLGSSLQDGISLTIPPGSSHSMELIKHIYDYLLSNTNLWIHAAPEVQIKLYQFLSNDFLGNGVVFNKTRCVNAVLQCLNAIKYYYWLVNPRDRSGIISKIPENAPELSFDQLSTIRSSIFLFIKNLTMKCHNGVLDEELQGFLNFLTVVNEDENIRHVLYFCVNLMAEHPSTAVPAFDHKQGVKVVFKLLGSPDETIRIMALKLLGLYLQRSTHKRKQDSMVPHNLFSLIGERLLLFCSFLTMSMYNTLYEILTEKMTLTISSTPHQVPDKTHRLENPLLLKVIAHLIRQSQITKELIHVRKTFLSDLNHMCNNSRDNRRTVLQMSVWQDWLFMLAPLSPQNQDQEQMLDAVLNLVRQLLHHALKYEYGGWRVWIDTLAILHSKVAYYDFRRDMRMVYEQYEQDRADTISDPNLRRQYGLSTVSGVSNNSGYRLSREFGEDMQKDSRETPEGVDLAESVARTIIDHIVGTACESAAKRNLSQSSETSAAFQNQNPDAQMFSPGPRSIPFRIPEFSWSTLHQRLLHDLLWCIESDLQIWKRSNNRNILEFVNAPENQIYIVNLVHLVTMLSDSLITCCGGLLPLLAAATSPSGDVDMLENGQGLKMYRAISFLLRVMNIADIVVFASSINFSELEQEKTMSSGGILRQCLRLVCTCAVRNCLENRFRDLHCQLFNEACLYDQYSPNNSKYGDNLPPDPIQELIRGLRPRSGDTQVDELQLQNYPISDPEVLLQEMDINRLRAVIYRDVEESKQAQFLALSIVYFLSVLMVSRYRDLLEPPPNYDSYSVEESYVKEVKKKEKVSLQISSIPKTNYIEAVEEGSDTDDSFEEREGDVNDNKNENEVDEESEEKMLKEISLDQNEDEEQCEEDIYARVVSAEPDGRKSRISGKFSNSEYQPQEDIERSSSIMDHAAVKDNIIATTGIASIHVDSCQQCDQRQVQPFNTKLPEFPEHTRHEELMDSDDDDDGQVSFPSSVTLTKRLEQALGGSAPLVREVFFDFSTYLSRTLIGSHGQELVSAGLVTLKQSTSVVEMVMLLCSQEWQNSLQKHAGLAFIELVNEGRLLAHASRDHTVRVANEAYFILSRMRAEDVQKHSDFTRFCAVTHQERQTEEKLSEHLIASARSRDEELADKLRVRVERLVHSNHGVWGACDQAENEFYRLDFWEDDSRRRRKLVPNPYGSSHSEAILSTSSLRGESPLYRDKNKTETISNALKELNIKANVVAGVSLNENTLSNENSHGVTDEELQDAERFDTKINEDNQIEPDLESEQDLSESSFKNVDNKDLTFNKVPDDSRSVINTKKDTTMKEAGESYISKPLNIDISGPVVLSTPGLLLAPGVNVYGSISITKSELYFEMDSTNKNNIGLDNKVLCYMQHLHGKWHFSEIRAVFSRRFLHKNVALEIFVANRTAVMFAFPDQDTVKKVVYALPRVGIGIKYNVSQIRKSSLASPRQIFKLSNMTQRWQQREISNFDYLMYLNTIAGRTFNDLNQYHIFPWVLANYESEHLDLSSPSNYRDLSSPIGALNSSRKQFFDNRFKNWDDDSQPPFHYGTHYSTSAFVLNYLIRVEPFTTLFLNLQGGKFDHADRTFHEVAQTWKNSQRDTSDVKELIPEFFYLPELFHNNNRYRFGKSEDGNVVDDVILPKWAQTPEDFVRINKQALESEFVSCQLHHWIDLIFGYKQRGPEAVRATNVFCYLTYEGSVNWDEVHDPMLKQALEDQIRSFGQTPSQLLTEPHPPRNSALHVSPLMFTPVHTDLLMMLKFISNSPIVWMAANVHLQLPTSAVLSISANYIYGVNKWNHSAADISRRPVTMQTSLPGSLTGTLPLASPSSNTNNQGALSKSPLSTNLSNIGSFSDKQSFVSSNVQLPLQMDPFLTQTNLISRRSLGDGFDVCLKPHNLQFLCTADNRVIFASGFWDKSFRIYSVDSGRLLQVVYGHFGVVTCMARSECGFTHDCYIVTGSEDCTIMLWLWGHRQQALLGDMNCREVAQPRLTITGHQAAIVCIQISGELGLIASASRESKCLLHTTQGELLRTLQMPGSFSNILRLMLSRDGYIVLVTAPCVVSLFNLNGRALGHIVNVEEGTSLRSDLINDNALVGSKISSVAMTREGDYVVLASEDGCVRLRRFHNLELVHCYPRCDAAISSVTITTDQRFILAGLCNGCIVMFNVDFNKWHYEYRDRYPAL